MVSFNHCVYCQSAIGEGFVALFYGLECSEDIAVLVVWRNLIELLAPLRVPDFQVVFRWA